MSMTSPTPPARATGRARELVTQAEALVCVWNQADDGLTPRIAPAQRNVLSVLRQSGPMQLTDVAAAVGAIPSSASRLCDRLEAAGLVRREVPRDNLREVWVSVTLEGMRRLDGFDAARCETFGGVVDAMSAPGRAALLDGLRAFASAVPAPVSPVVGDV